MKDNKIKYNGKIINLDELSNEEILALKEDVDNKLKESIGNLKKLYMDSKRNDDSKSR